MIDSLSLAPQAAVKQIVAWNYLTRAHASCNELLTSVMYGDFITMQSTCSPSDVTAGNAYVVHSTDRLLLKPGQNGNDCST